MSDRVLPFRDRDEANSPRRPGESIGEYVERLAIEDHGHDPNVADPHELRTKPWRRGPIEGSGDERQEAILSGAYDRREPGEDR